MLPLYAAVAQSTSTKGTRVLGVSAGNLFFRSEASTSAFDVALEPVAGVFFANNWAVGVALPIEYHAFRYKRMDEHHNELITGVAPWLRFYIPSQSRHRVFAEAQIGALYNAYWGRQLVYDPLGVPRIGDFKGHDFGGFVRIGAGYSYFLTPSVAIETMAAYQQGGFTSGYDGLTLTIGLRAYLGQ
ncbi:hypothetical protein [Hymenobacter rigui]|uniref:Outer membrane protein beta-barrel domain-containing protein n=1 Tax=Hymenobacter rigui TaxID=334424 RepID=A0A3R9MMX0_9BACT|nr:hypothetical protein [Hymenobacter rigui]RSK49505.1 hypothetical protein EI291_08420 [Hymenobacter rigui]